MLEYQAQIALNKKFTKGKKSTLVMFQGAVFKKLKKKKTYYVRVRAIGYGGKKGSWSTVKRIKIKK